MLCVTILLGGSQLHIARHCKCYKTLFSTSQIVFGLFFGLNFILQFKVTMLWTRALNLSYFFTLSSCLKTIPFYTSTFGRYQKESAFTRLRIRLKWFLIFYLLVSFWFLRTYSAALFQINETNLKNHYLLKLRHPIRFLLITALALNIFWLKTSGKRWPRNSDWRHTRFWHSLNDLT